MSACFVRRFSTRGNKVIRNKLPLTSDVPFESHLEAATIRHRQMLSAASEHMDVGKEGLFTKGSSVDLGIGGTADTRVHPSLVGVLSEAHRYSATEKNRKRDMFRYGESSERSVVASSSATTAFRMKRTLKKQRGSDGEASSMVPETELHDSAGHDYENKLQPIIFSVSLVACGSAVVMGTNFFI